MSFVVHNPEAGGKAGGGKSEEVGAPVCMALHHSGKSSDVWLSSKEELLSDTTAGLRSPQEVGSGCIWLGAG